MLIFMYLKLKPLPPGQELQVDMARQHRMQINVALIEARDREEREQMRLLSATPPPVALAPAPGTPRSEEPPGKPRSVEYPSLDDSQRDPRETALPGSTRSPFPNPNPWKTPDSGEPEAWAPRARGRGDN